MKNSVNLEFPILPFQRAKRTFTWTIGLKQTNDFISPLASQPGSFVTHENPGNNGVERNNVIKKTLAIEAGR